MPMSAMKKMQSKMTPEKHKEGMALWMAWAKKCGKKLVDLGSPLGKGVKLTSKGSSPSTKNVAGYSILKASNMAEAKKLLKNHPHIKWNAACQIEVHEALPMPK